MALYSCGFLARGTRLVTYHPEFVCAAGAVPAACDYVLWGLGRGGG